MKRICRILICILLVVATFALVSCDDKPQAKQLSDLTLPRLKDNQAAVIIKNGDNDYVSYTVNLDKVGEGDVTAEDVIQYLHDEADLYLDWQNGTFGKFLNAIGGVVPNPNAANYEYVEVFTSNTAYQGTWAGVDKYEVGDVTLVAANYGVSELIVAAGDVIYFELATY